MKTIKYIIVEDEPWAHVALLELMKIYPDFICIGQFYDGREAQNFLLVNTPDLVFLDINIPSINGFDLLRSIKRKFNAIITTGHSDYAVDSFGLSAIDYLMKPISPDRLEFAINKVLDKIYLANDLQSYKSKYYNINFENNKEFDFIEILIVHGTVIKIY